MSCTSPLLAVRLYKPSLGKMAIKILPQRVESFQFYVDRYGKENMMMLPCGRCQSCLSKRAKEWSVRCALESLDHRENCFCTLTYDPDHYEKRDVHQDWKDFIKALRNKGYQLRYFGCCERGDEFGRQHFHILLFGFFPSDAHRWAKSKSGVMQYTSEILSSCWKKGLCVVAEFSPYAAQYTAGYVVKKFALGEKDSFHFQSTKPGIGAGYVLRNMQEIYENDKLILSFGSHKFAVPRYFDKLAENCALDLNDIKAKRLDCADIMTAQEIREHGFNGMDQLLVHREEVAKSNIRFQKRRF